jgi:hypothetical protein
LLAFLVLGVKLKLTISCSREVSFAFPHLQTGVVLRADAANEAHMANEADEAKTVEAVEAN